jgi:octaprenyl-diphosphate synthase
MTKTNLSFRTEHKDVEKKQAVLNALETQLKQPMQEVNKLILSRFHSDVPLIPQIAAYLIAAGGKRIRPLLTLAGCALTLEQFENAQNNQIEHSFGYAAAIEFIHTATLLHDDVVDESDQRRGKTSANRAFGNQSTVLVGDFLFSKSFELMVEGHNIEALSMLARAAATIAEGEVLQLSLKGNIDMTLDQYLKVIECKTGALFRAGTQCGALVAVTAQTGHQNQNSYNESHQAFISALYQYGHYLGLCFQITDDLIDYTSSQDEMGKGRGDDFREGKITLPVLFAIQKARAENAQEEIEFWSRCLKDNAQQDNDFEHALTLIHKRNTLNGSKSLNREYAEKAKQSLSIFKDSPLQKTLLELVDYVVERAS